tara:strand:+ start:15347 stop:15688 length:342 start_codon:yes stop_codon:yes gene_type:complete
MGSFETAESNSNRWHQPVRVPSEKSGIFGAAKEMAEDMPGWKLESVDEERLEIHSTRANGALGGTSKITVRVEGPEGIPNSSTHCRSESSGGFLSRDKKNVAEFIQKFWMRVT